MEIDVRKLCAKGEYTGGFSYDYEASDDECLIPLCKIDGTVKVFGNFEIYDDDSVGVTFTVKYKLSGSCSYCLNPAEKSVEFQSDVLFVTNSDDENYIYDGRRVDLVPAVHDAILISQPEILLCKEGCEGIDVIKK